MRLKATGKIRSTSKMLLLTCAAALLVSGCEIVVEPPEAKPAPQIKMPAAQAALVGLGAMLEKQQTEAATKPAPAKKTVDANQGMSDQHDPKSPPYAAATPGPHENKLLLAANDQPQNNRPTFNPNVKFDVPQAVDEIGLEIRDAMELRKTLVVLLAEQTPKASTLVSQVADRFTQLARDLTTSQPGLFEMAVLGYSNDVNLIMPDPTSNASQIEVALSSLKDSKGDKANLFAAVNKAVEKFLSLRMHGYEVLFVVVGNSPGDDLNLADPPIKALLKAAIPVYGIGPALPFGSPRFKIGGGRHAPGETSDRPSESLYPERIQLSLSGNQNTVDLNDSGYGPFGLERLCRLTEGKFFRLHTPRPQGWQVDSSLGDIKPELALKYAPDYVNEAGYQHRLEENKCRMALHNASMFPPAEGLGQVTTEFAKQKDEAQLAKNITNAQKAAAIDDQPLQRLYDTLTAAEGDRPKLTGARWQAGYDLAMGQVLAAKARLDGYNAILAIIKQGKAFANPDSTKWVLEPANENAAGSVLDKMAKKSRTYLQRVVDEHPGTPWAAVAQRELKYEAGWKLEEK